MYVIFQWDYQLYDIFFYFELAYIYEIKTV